MEATLRYVAPCQFGLEGILAGELRQMDAQDVLAENGRVLFSGGLEIMARACWESLPLKASKGCTRA